MGFSSSGNSEGSLMSNSSYTDLLTHTHDGRPSTGIPKFKSVTPPSLPLSPPPFSPSSYFAIPAGLSPADLLDSPVLLSSSSTLLPSPTTGAFGAQALNWKPNSNRSTKQQDDHANKYFDFTFQTQARPPVSSTCLFPSSFTSDQAVGASSQNHQHPQQSAWAFLDQNHQNDPSSFIKAMVKSELPTSQSQDYNLSRYEPGPNSSFQPAQYIREQKKSDDGYNWRKYGQKQVKGSENPRSYYKCTYPNCPMKKKIEKSLEGQITEIVYKGNHNHPKPVSTRRSSGSASATFQASLQHSQHDFQDQTSLVPQGSSSGQMDSVATPDNSSISLVDDDLDVASHRSTIRSVGDDFDDEAQPEAKRWKGEVETECMSAAPGNRTVREPRVVVHTTSDIDILDDGYRWRKYGQKVVKGNPNPRSYYKCTHPGCPVRKHVERAAHDLRAVITTYEGKHNHEVPAARGSGMNRHLSSGGNNGAMPSTAIRPSAVNYITAGNSNPVQMSQRLPASSEGGSGQLSPFTLEMLQNPGSFGFSGFVSQAQAPALAQYTDSMFSNNRAKEEPKDDMFFESMLC